MTGEEHPIQWLGIDKSFTASMLIHALTEMIKKHGDLKIVVIGCYASSGDVLDVGYKKYDMPDGDAIFASGDCILLHSDICSG